MARIKPTEIKPIVSIEEANQTLAEIAALDRQINNRDNRLNDEIDRLKAERDADLSSVKAQRKNLVNNLQAYAEYNKAELFKDKKTKEVTFGFFGFRKNTKILGKTKITLGMVLAKVKELGLTSAVRTKEELNKEELHTWSDEKLDMVGARRVIKDDFWCEVKEEVDLDI